MENTQFSQNNEILTATVEKITYRNDSNAYTVAVVKAEKESVTIVGIMPFLNEGDTAVFEGNYIFHSTYGRQFSVKAFERKAPQNKAAVLRYLSSGALKGIGPSTAAKIVERFGEDSLDIYRTDLHSLRL